MEDFKQKGSRSKCGMVFKPFGKHKLTCVSVVIHELRPVFSDARFYRILCLTIMNVSCLFLLWNWCYATSSVGLQSFLYILGFDFLSLFICCLSIWVEQKKPNQHFTFGYERFEVLAIFLATTFIFINSLFLTKKSFEKWIYQTRIHTGRFFPGVALGFLCHMIVTYFTKNKVLNLVICASSFSFLQKYFTGVSQNFYHNIPGFHNSVIPRFNPLTLLGWISAAILIIAQLFIDVYNFHSADSIAAICITVMICATMFPMSAYSAKILLQGTPPHIADLLDKCLREASTLDGVLEFRNEHFWLLGYDKIVGSVHVRIRRDANEQVVLSHLLAKLSSLISDLTIQVFKDEWSWSSSTLQILNESYMKFPTNSVSPISATDHVQSIQKALPNYKLAANNSLKLPYTGSSPNLDSKPLGKLPYSPYSIPPSLQRSSTQQQTQNESITVNISDSNKPTSSLSAFSETPGASGKSFTTANIQRTLWAESTPNDRTRIVNTDSPSVSTAEFLKSYKN